MKGLISITALIVGISVGAILTANQTFDENAAASSVNSFMTKADGFDHLPLASIDTAFNKTTTPKSQEFIDPVIVTVNTDLLSEEYGIDANNLTVHKDYTKSRQVLSDILLDCNVDYAKIDDISQQAKDIVNLKKLKINRPYLVLCDSLQQAKYFIYEENTTDFVVFDLQDSVKVYKRQKEIQERWQISKGVIHGSLYKTLANNNINPLLAKELSEVFAWSVNFFKLYKGDSFKAIYKEKFVNGESVGLGEIVAAYFKHGKQEFYAFAFEQNGKTMFFDEEGKSLQRIFLQAPLAFKRISSHYTLKRYHPVLKRYKPHFGTDFAAPTGTPIMSVGKGVIEEIGYSRGNGNFIKIKHTGVYATQYLHMSKFAKGMKKGKRVEQKEVIGYVGSTGLATGPHLCYRFWKNGKQVNGMAQKPPAEKQVAATDLPKFLAMKDSLSDIFEVVDYQVQAEDIFASEPDLLIR